MNNSPVLLDFVLRYLNDRVEVDVNNISEARIDHDGSLLLTMNTGERLVLWLDVM